MYVSILWGVPVFVFMVVLIVNFSDFRRLLRNWKQARKQSKVMDKFMREANAKAAQARAWTLHHTWDHVEEEWQSLLARVNA